MYVRMVRDHEYVVDKKTGVRRRIPLGWVGNVDEAIGKAAVDAGNAVDMSQPKGLKTTEDEVKTAAEVLEMADTAHFQTFRSEAVKVLGDDTPTTKAEIVAALEALTGE